jgi:hypothetical protein
MCTPEGSLGTQRRMARWSGRPLVVGSACQTADPNQPFVQRASGPSCCRCRSARALLCSPATAQLCGKTAPLVLTAKQLQSLRIRIPCPRQIRGQMPRAGSPPITLHPPDGLGTFITFIYSPRLLKRCATRSPRLRTVESLQPNTSTLVPTRRNRPPTGPRPTSTFKPKLPQWST